MRPLRCPATSVSINTVTTIAPAVAMITCEISAPPAGGDSAAASTAVLGSMFAFLPCRRCELN